jgi:hypothetical protein
LQLERDKTERHRRGWRWPRSGHDPGLHRLILGPKFSAKERKQLNLSRF